MKKVCHLTSAHQSDDVRIFHKECTSLASHGYKVYLIAQGESYEKNGVQIIGFGKLPRSRFERVIRTTHLVLKIAMEVDADIYHIHDPELLPLAIKLKKHGKKVIFDSHENYEIQILHKEYIARFFRLLLSKLYKRYELYVVRRIDAVIAPCSFNGDDIFLGACRRLVYISNFPIVKGEGVHNRIDSTTENHELSICYVGKLTHERGITHLIKASYKANAKLILAGTFGCSGYRNQILNMAEYACVDYRGQLSCEDLFGVFRDSKIGVCTILNIGQYNTGDSLATKVYEYMTAALPVIMSDSRYARNMMEEYRFGICVQPDNVDEIAETITYLLNNPEVATKMGENGRCAIEMKFNWTEQETILFRLYNEMLEEYIDEKGC